MNTETLNTADTLEELNTKARVQYWTEKHNVTMEADFVPFSKSRNSEEKTPSLNWKITLKQDGHDFMRFDYMQGCGHCPAYKNKRFSPYEKQKAISKECEQGKEIVFFRSMDWMKSVKPLPVPSIIDVLYSIVSDASAIDYPTYEDFATQFGYESDSRKGEAIYKQCLEYGLKLRAAVGDQGIRELQSATQDW